ncbi:MAG: hypothetical protein COW84_01420 [Gammaproteobacteria bacterium CG22_combo_CG10-13_8_21_14_all_40_8]|nr:MAG: hypothetical protein COW84_01420 [Gammaproteobacteria bacterium CG22_combo_CG10-13_8_21_14_all_40_8]
MTQNPLIKSYQDIFNRLSKAVSQGEKISLKFWEDVESQLIQLEHYTEQDASRLVQSIQRDLSETRQVLFDAGQAIEHWLEWDMQVVEEELSNWVKIVADPSTVDWLFLKQQWEQSTQYQTGDSIGIGKIHCIRCGQLITFSHTSIIPECPHCQGKDFQREPIF